MNRTGRNKKICYADVTSTFPPQCDPAWQFFLCNREFQRNSLLHKKSSVPCKRDEAYPRYHPDSRINGLSCRLTRSITALPTDKVQKRSSGAKLRYHLNLRKLTAGDFLSLKENDLLKTPSWLFLFSYYATMVEICQVIYFFFSSFFSLFFSMAFPMFFSISSFSFSTSSRSLLSISRTEA